MRKLLITVLLFLGMVTPAHAEWRKAVSPSFIVYGDMKEDALLAFTQKVERFDTVLRRRFKIPGEAAPVRLTIFIVGASVSVSKLMATNQQNVRGFFTLGPNGPMAVSQRLRSQDKFDLDADTILFHEYGHHFMYQYFPAPFPDWFSEGFAEFYSTTSFDPKGRAELGRPAFHRAYDLMLGQALPVQTLLTARIADLSKEQVSSLYARGWLLTHFLQFTPARAGQFDAYYRAIRESKPPLEAAQSAFGDLAKLDKDLNAYRDAQRMRFSQEVNPTPVPTDIKVALLDAAESAIIMDRLNLMQRANDEQRRDLVISLTAKRAKFPTSAAVAALLAQAQYEAEDYDAAKIAADAALAIDPANAHAQLYKGMAEMRLLIKNDVVDPAQWKSARGFLVKANRANPEDPYPLYHYYRSYRDQGRNVPKIAGEGLAKALFLLPADPQIRFSYIEYLISEKRLPEALAQAKLLLLAPHGNGDNETTRKMISDIEYAIAHGGNFPDRGGDIAGH